MVILRNIRYLVHVQKWTYLALGWPYGWALNFNIIISYANVFNIDSVNKYRDWKQTDLFVTVINNSRESVNFIALCTNVRAVYISVEVPLLRVCQQFSVTSGGQLSALRVSGRRSTQGSTARVKRWTIVLGHFGS